MPRNIAVPILAAVLACTPPVDDPTAPRDIYEQQGHLFDADVAEVFAGCPSDDDGPWTLRYLDAPQPDEVYVRFEFSKPLTAEGAACFAERFQKLGVADIETDTFAGDYPELPASSPTRAPRPSSASPTGSASSTRSSASARSAAAAAPLRSRR